jgi:2'-5' RNA ligase
MSPVESAWMVLVPEAELLVKPFRDRYDPSAAGGMPAHITLLYPFKHPDEVDRNVLDHLCQCFDRCPPFRFSFAPIRRFPDAVLYLTPEPDEPFRQLTFPLSLRLCRSE